MATLDPSTSPVLNPATAPKPPSVFEDVVDIFYAPGAVFERRKHGQFFTALLIAVVLASLIIILLWNAIEPAMDADITRGAQRQMEKARASGQPVPPNVEEAMSRMRPITLAVYRYGMGFFLGIGALISGVIIWIVGKFFDAKQTFGQAMTVATYSLYPLVLSFLVWGVQGLLLPAEQIDGTHRFVLGPARFLGPGQPSPFLFELIKRIEPFAIWSTIITGIGLSVTGGISRGKGLAAAAVIFVLGSLLAAALGGR